MKQITNVQNKRKRGRPTKRPPLELTSATREILEETSRSRTAQARRVERASILLAYASEESIGAIIKKFESRAKVEGCIDKALALGPLAALEDLSGRGRPSLITPEAKVWVVSIACQKPKDIGYPHELWTISLLARYIRENSSSVGHPCLINTGKSAIFRILSEAEIKPHKIRYYLEKKDPNFDSKMAEVLLVYNEVHEIRQQEGSLNQAILSYDEKPGIQAIDTVAPDLMPVPAKHSTVSRDYEYKRLGTISLMAGVDLVSGHVHIQIEERHRSKEFVEFLRKLDCYYDKDMKIRVILDNHSAHKSKETLFFLQTLPGRFEFVFTPTHASWLNVIETMFSKIARSVLRSIRVSSVQELKERILEYFRFLNEDPTPPTWQYGLAGTKR